MTAPGWTIIDKMYVFNGTVYLVTSEPENIPDRKYMTSMSQPIANEPEKVAARLPTDKEMRIISPNEAHQLFGTGANRVEGVTVRRHFRPCFCFVSSVFPSAASGWSTTRSNCRFDVFYHPL
jgi:hypothetical protein